MCTSTAICEFGVMAQTNKYAGSIMQYLPTYSKPWTEVTLELDNDSGYRHGWTR